MLALKQTGGVIILSCDALQAANLARAVDVQFAMSDKLSRSGAFQNQLQSLVAEHHHRRRAVDFSLGDERVEPPKLSRISLQTAVKFLLSDLAQNFLFKDVSNEDFLVRALFFLHCASSKLMITFVGTDW